MSNGKKDEEPKRLRTFIVSDALWEEVQDLARRETRQSGKFVSASDVIRNAAIREVMRLRKRLGK